MHSCLSGQQESYPSYSPLGGLLLGLQVEGPDEGWAALARLVHRAIVHVLSLLPIHRDRLDEHDRHGWGELLQTRVRDNS